MNRTDRSTTGGSGTEWNVTQGIGTEWNEVNEIEQNGRQRSIYLVIINLPGTFQTDLPGTFHTDLPGKCPT